MSTVTRPRAPSTLITRDSPPLRAGDHLDQRTFHRRYESMPRSFRAELVKGVVVVPSPLGCPHGHYYGIILTWMGVYALSTPGTRFFDNTTTILDSENEFQPDAQLVILPECGGQGVTLDKYVEGTPHLVVEVAASSEAYDLYEKFEVYQRSGVQEYLVATTSENQVRWFVSETGKFQTLPADDRGIIRSRLFPGLWLDTTALFAENPAGLLTVLQQGLADPAHAEFVKRLATHRQSAGAQPT